jgi:hypothetical protein
MFQIFQPQRPANFDYSQAETLRYIEARDGNVKMAVAKGMYAMVATATASSLNELFALCNGMGEGTISKVLPMTSMSVGDIARDDSGNYFACLPVGWGAVTNSFMLNKLNEACFTAENEAYINSF